MQLRRCCYVTMCQTRCHETQHVVDMAAISWHKVMCEALPGVAYPGVRDNRSTLNTKTGYDDDMMKVVREKSSILQYRQKTHCGPERQLSSLAFSRVRQPPSFGCIRQAPPAPGPSGSRSITSSSLHMQQPDRYSRVLTQFRKLISRIFPDYVW